MRGSRKASIGWIVALGVMAGCASSGATGGTQTQQGEGVAAGSSIIVIRNSQPGASSITAYMQPEVGVDTPLGNVNGGQTAQFPFDGPPGRYRIRTVGPAGEVVSDVFQLFPNSMVRWDMSLGRSVIVGSRRGS